MILVLVPVLTGVAVVDDSLKEYRRKRDFKKTSEPEPGGLQRGSHSGAVGGRYVIQKHAARRLHYDLRLEQDGVFKSWAVPKGPSLEAGAKNLAVRVEDHPLEYGDFEGVIPRGEYGGGTVMLWDRGQWTPIEEKGKGGSKGKNDENHIDFVLVGEKLRGAWTLVRTKSKHGEDADNWLLIKRSDNAHGESKITDRSVATGRTMEQIAADRNRTWSRKGGEISEDIDVPDADQLDGARKGMLPVTPLAALATLAKDAPVGDEWLHEIKFDGYRILARLENGKASLISRNGIDWTRRFPEIAALVQALPVESAVLDGEVVSYAPDGASSFRGLQEALSVGRTHNLVYQAFDLQYLNGYDLKSCGLRVRKQGLKELLAAGGFTPLAGIRFTEHIQGMGPRFAEQACKLGLEGIICKRVDSRYMAGRTKNWLKVKCTAREELLICGYTDAGGARSGFGSLVLGAWHRDQIIYCGKVGTGFSDSVLRSLSARMRKLTMQSSSVSNPPPEKVKWIDPQLIAEVEFTEWTRDGVLRHPSFRGLREDRDPQDITLPPDAPDPGKPKPKQVGIPTTAVPKPSHPGKTPTRDSATIAGVTITNASRVLFPDAGVTKLEIAQFYEEIGQWIVPQLSCRPLSLVRCPEGLGGECFFQKHPRETISKSIPRVLIDEKNGPRPYLYVKSVADIVGLVQFGALELHVWGSRVNDVEHPDILVFDLDPGPNVPNSQLLIVAQELRERLADLGLNSFARTTGGKGLHLVVPIDPVDDWTTVKEFSHQVAQQYAQTNSSRVTSNMAKARRRGRIFIDYLRNGRGATAIGSFSTRARPGAPVAVPVSWDEMTEALRPDRFTVENLRRRLAALRSDPWEGFASRARPLPSLTN